MIISTSDLVKRGMLAADMHDAPVTPAQSAFWLTQDNIALAIFLARAGWTSNLKTQTITVAGSEAGRFELTYTPLAIVAVHQISTSGAVRRIRFSDSVNFLRQQVSSTLVKGDPAEFRAIWDQDDDSVVLNFYPAPNTGTQILVSYIPHPVKLVLTAPGAGEDDEVHYPLGFEEFIVLKWGIRALDREESDSAALKDQLAECMSYIEQAAWERVYAGAAVRNVDGDERGWSSKLTYPPASEWWFI